jgi:two-component sensor histidine kinase
MKMRTNILDSVRSDAWLYIDEINHRTINDYVFLIGSLDQARRLSNDETGAMTFEPMRQRMESAAQVYRALAPPSGESEYARLDLELERLCKALSISLLAERGITLTLVCDPMSTTTHACWQIKLIVSELVTNAARHAFGDRDAGAVAVNVAAAGDDFRCAVSDNGVGASEIFPGRGCRITDALARELGGEILREYAEGGSMMTLVVNASAPAELCLSSPLPAHG